jgi:hypothetical protein
MCLNYEHHRNRKAQKAKNKEENNLHKAESHIKNLKLRFSRKLTCYSFLLSILWVDKHVLKQSDVIEIIRQTPLQRLKALSERPNIRADVNQLISLYFWFLQITQIEKRELQDWISDEKNRNDAFEKSRVFAKTIFELMIAADNKDALMYFLV